MKKHTVLTLAVAGSLLASTAVTIADTTASTTSSVTVKPFSDVEVNSPYATYIAELKQKGVLSGNPDGSFGPSKSLTRAQFAVMLVKAFNLPTSSKDTKFVDAKTHWGKTYIESAFEAGIVAGTSDTTFGPELTLTREQAAAMVWRYVKAHGITATLNDILLTPGTDDWAKEAVQNTVAYRMYGPNEVTQIASGAQDYQSTQTMTRQSAAALIDMGLRLLDQVKPSPTSTAVYLDHVGSNLSPVKIQKGLTVKFDNNDGTLNRTTTVVDVLNPTDDTNTNLMHDASGKYTFGNVPIITVVAPEAQYADVMQKFTDQMNDGAKLFSQVTFTSQGQGRITVNLPSTSGTPFHWKYLDNNAQIQVATSSTLQANMMNVEGVRFQFFLDNDATPGVMHDYFGRADIVSHGQDQFSFVYGTIDIN